jgi:hypothetical protein
MSTIDTILGTVNNAQANLDKVESKLFKVIKAPIPAESYLDKETGKTIELKESTEEFNVFTDRGTRLGVMKGQFEPLQPKEFYDNIISTVHEFGADLDLSTLKFRTFSGSKKIEFSIALKPFTFINNKKVLDETNLSVTFSTSYDGSKSSTIALFTQRVVCTNGMVANKLQGTLKGRNIISGKAKILSYASELAEIINGATEFKEKMEALDKIKLNKAQIEKFKLELLGFNKESLLANEKDAKSNGKSFGILDSIELGMFKTENEFKELPKDYFSSPQFDIDFKAFKAKEYIEMTAFEVLQSVTNYTNHIAKIKSDKDENIRFGTGFKLNSKAQELLFELVEA